ncbi:MAG: AraC family transcriptional regulator [Clostridiales bacterium]|nr:AraC family transcriptional regulator [Clostridiales bacterium]
MNRDVMGLIVKRDDGSEIVNYDDPQFPSYVFEGWVRPKVTWERVPHFHEDIEMCTITQGKMAYSVNGKTIMLHEGDTIFINSNQIHYSMSIDDEGARYVIAIFHPGILNATVAVEMQAIRPITDNKDLSYLRFREIDEMTEEVKRLMRSLLPIRHCAFELTKQYFQIWDLVIKRSEIIGAIGPEEAPDARMQTFKNMMHFISNNYQRTLTLEEISGSANISKSLCNLLFNQYVGESPINYLLHFRARKVAEYLRSSNLNMTEIATLCGFSGTSYMSEIFKKIFNISPRDYRKDWRQVNASLDTETSGNSKP